MQARVEGAIGYSKQHSRVSMLAANVPMRWWPQATTDFVIKKNYLWYSAKGRGCSTAHQRMRRPTSACGKSLLALALPWRSLSEVG
jgi:hypothetical protein